MPISLHRIDFADKRIKVVDSDVTGIVRGFSTLAGISVVIGC